MAIEYRRDAVPDEQALAADVRFMAELLDVLYRAGDESYVPGDAVLEVVEALDAAESTAGRAGGRAGGQGFRLTAGERRAVEAHAMATVTAACAAQGWLVEDVSRSRSFDLLLTRGAERLHVEVKGTVSEGRQVVLTRAEVEAQRRFAPDNALAVVHSIALDRAADPPRAKGGRLRWISPWEIEDESLTVVSYIHRTPR
ncbi:uncharacterized protein DUF3883 [Allonocardiopsis opalescens]|uniref:Uncharacterized protein DUF3883 n=1 Tax=Allonocardiopsis opalescens TaxID=1144618 RepID=A0A2T0Q4D8_9ACTN|nr:uncharacterized protein DUF3883 [Allonocardiopsis opalescens]